MQTNPTIMKGITFYAIWQQVPKKMKIGIQVAMIIAALMMIGALQDKYTR